MSRHLIRPAAAALLGAAGLLLASATLPGTATAHDPQGKPASFSAGEPGDPKKPARTVKVVMAEDGKRMLFEPATVEVRRGEQVRFVLTNEGDRDHEFMLGTKADNRKHAAVMQKHPEMEHDDPNAKRLSPLSSGELLWKFTKRGQFEYACLIPGHYEAGMFGKIIVK